MLFFPPNALSNISRDGPGNFFDSKQKFRLLTGEHERRECGETLCRRCFSLSCSAVSLSFSWLGAFNECFSLSLSLDNFFEHDFCDYFLQATTKGKSGHDLGARLSLSLTRLDSFLVYYNFYFVLFTTNSKCILKQPSSDMMTNNEMSRVVCFNLKFFFYFNTIVRYSRLVWGRKVLFLFYDWRLQVTNAIFMLDWENIWTILIFLEFLCL